MKIYKIERNCDFLLQFNRILYLNNSQHFLKLLIKNFEVVLNMFLTKLRLYFLI